MNTFLVIQVYENFSSTHKCCKSLIHYVSLVRLISFIRNEDQAYIIPREISD
jgi:hypothetical protein